MVQLANELNGCLPDNVRVVSYHKAAAASWNVKSRDRVLDASKIQDSFEDARTMITDTVNNKALTLQEVTSFCSDPQPGSHQLFVCLRGRMRSFGTMVHLGATNLMKLNPNLTPRQAWSMMIERARKAEQDASDDLREVITQNNGLSFHLDFQPFSFVQVLHDHLVGDGEVVARRVLRSVQQPEKQVCTSITPRKTKRGMGKATLRRLQRAHQVKNLVIKHVTENDVACNVYHFERYRKPNGDTEHMRFCVVRPVAADPREQSKAASTVLKVGSGRSVRTLPKKRPTERQKQLNKERQQRHRDKRKGLSGNDAGGGGGGGGGSAAARACSEADADLQTAPLDDDELDFLPDVETDVAPRETPGAEGEGEGAYHAHITSTPLRSTPPHPTQLQSTPLHSTSLRS